MCPSELGHRASSNSHPLFPISPDTSQGPNISLSMKRLLFKREFFFNLCMYLFLAVLGLYCCPQAFSGYSEGGLLSWSTCSRYMGFNSCSTWESLSHSMRHLLGPGIESMSSALAGRFLTTGPPGKS